MIDRERDSDQACMDYARGKITREEAARRLVALGFAPGIVTEGLDEMDRDKAAGKQ